MNNWNTVKEYLPFLIPLVILQLALMGSALYHILKHPNYRFGNRLMWVVIVVIFQLIGPICYFTFGKGEQA